MRFISHHEIEQGLVCDRVRAVIVGKFCVGDLIGPGSWIRSAEDPQVSFNLLIDTFSFTIKLWVVDGGKGEVIVQELAKLFRKGRGKLWVTVRDDFVIESEAEVNFVEEEDSYILDGDGFLSGAENYPLHKSVVNHNQQTVEAGGEEKVGDQVTRDLLEEMGHARSDWGEWGDGGVSIQFILLAHGAAFDVFAHILHEAQPPELSDNKLAGFKITRVTGGLMVMAAGRNGAAEGVIRRNIDMAFISKDMVIKFPVREVGPECIRDVFQGCLEVL